VATEQGTPAERASEEATAVLARIDAALALDDADRAERGAALHYRAAQIHLARPDGEDEALRHLRSSWELDPSDLDVCTLLGMLLERCGQRLDAARVYSDAAGHLGDASEAGALLFRAVELLRDEDEIVAALELLDRLGQLDSRELKARRIQMLEAIIDAEVSAKEPRRSALCAALTTLLADLEGERRFACAVELGDLLEDSGDKDGAHEAYRQALVIRPAAARALTPVREYLTRGEAFEELVAVMEGTIKATPARDQRAALLEEQALLLERALSDQRRAALCWWRAWELLPTSETPPLNLKRIYTESQDWHRYRQVLEREALTTLEIADKVAAYRELATFQRQVFSDELKAAQTYGFILHLVPDDEQALAARVEIFDKAQQQDALAAALRRYAAKTKETARRDELLRRLARLESRIQARTGGVLRTLRRLDQREEKNQQLVRELRQQAAEAGDTDRAVELGALLLEMLRRGDAAREERIALALALADECVESGAVGRAAECYRQALELHPDHPDAASGLKAIAHDDALTDPTPEGLAEHAEQLAEQQPERAVRLLIRASRVAAHRTGGAPLRSGPAADYLRRAADLCPAGSTAELRLLEDALWSTKLFPDLAQLLERLAEREEEPAIRKDVLRALARVYRDHLKKPKHAVKVLERVREVDPKEREVIQEVRELHTELGNHQQLAAVLEDLLSGASGDQRIPLLEELGRIYTEELDDSAATLSRYGELLSIRPNHGAALAYCRAHDTAAGDHRSVVVLLCRAAEAAEDSLGQAERHREIARIAELQLSDLEFAITHWRRVVELCPSDAAPRADLKRLLSQVGQWREVERVLLSEVSRSLRPEEKVPIYSELAATAHQHLQDDRAAASYLRNALQLAPDNQEVLTQLEEIYERQGHWRELTVVLRRHAEVAPEAADKIQLLHRAARIFFVHLNRDEEALATSRAVRELRPGDRVAATLMAEIYAKRSQWREKIELLREQTTFETDPPELGRLHLELGRILLDQLNDSASAAEHFEQALELDRGGGEVLPLLRQLYESLNRWDQLVELIRKRAAAETISTTERAAALCEIGRISEEHLSDREAAREAYERAIHLDPAHRPALTALRALAMGREQWRDLVAMARRELQLTEDPAERARLLVEMGEVLFQKMERPSAAAEALEEALEHDPGNTRAAERLGMIYFDNEDWERAGEFLEKVVSSGMELDNLHDYYYRLGYAKERLGLEDDAFSHYVKSFGREPMYLPTLERLVQLCYERRQWDNTLRISEAIVSTYADSKSPQELGDLYLKVGLSELHLSQREVAVKMLQKLVLEHGEMPQTAPEAWVDVAEPWAATPLELHLLRGVNADVLGRVVKAMERALLHVPNHPGALQVLAALSITRGDWERSLRYIDRAIEAIPGEPRLRVGLLVCAGDVSYRQILAAGRAKAYYRRALEILPGSELARDRLEMLQVTPALERGPQPQPPPPPTAPGMPPDPPQATEGTRRASPPPPPEQRIAHTPTKPLPFGMPPIPGGAPGAAPGATPGAAPGATPSATPDKVVAPDKTASPRPAPRSRPRRPDED
jgi:tetratricopeptide (TPR) repeat protein